MHGKNTRRLALSGGALAIALAFLLALTGASFAASSAGGGVLGILVERTEAPEGEEPPQSGDSVLSILLSSEQAEDVTVSFVVKVDGQEDESVFRTDVLEYGARVQRPDSDPAWPLDAWPGKDDGAPEPAFDCWCADEAGTRAWDFSEPVTAPLTLYAAFSQGEKVEIGLDANYEGAPAIEPIWRYPGSPYRELPQPARTGHVFLGWYGDREASGDAVAPESVVAGATTLYASWRPCAYRVRYVKNLESAGGPAWAEDPVAKSYGESFEVAGNEWFDPPANTRFTGWCTVAAPTEAVPGTRYAPGDEAENLASADGAWVDLYAQWEVTPIGSFTVTFDAAGGVWENGPGAADDETQKTVTVPAGSKVAEPGTEAEGAIPLPKKAGWQVSGWVCETASGEEAEWDFGRDAVNGNVTLRAVWALRLDVTLPVGVGFAIDATTGEAKGPDADKYALKSRTVAPVAVDALAAVSEQAELEGFFGLAEGAGWEDALEETSLSLKSAGAAQAVSLPLAGAQSGTTWRNAREIADAERPAWTLAAFSYSGVAFDEDWKGADPSNRLPVEFGLALSKKLEVRTNIDGPKPITHLVVTVSAQE